VFRPLASALTIVTAIGCASARSRPVDPAPAVTRAATLDGGAPPGDAGESQRDAAARLASDAGGGEPSPRRARATCPEGSAWNGKLCHGPGFDACPAGMHIDGDACLAADAPAPPRKPAERKPKPREKPEPEPEADDDSEEATVPSAGGLATGVTACDRFLQHYATCNALPAQTKDVLDGLARAWRSVGKDPRQRAAMQTACAQMEQTLRAACP
jgi:hypothetical protein